MGLEGVSEGLGEIRWGDLEVETVMFGDGEVLGWDGVAGGVEGGEGVEGYEEGVRRGFGEEGGHGRGGRIGIGDVPIIPERDSIILQGPCCVLPSSVKSGMFSII